jgi:phosphatidylglycerophosphate synthase
MLERHKPMLGLGIGLLIASFAAGAWEVLALQSPGTPLYIGMLPGPIGALRSLALALGLIVLVSALLMACSDQLPPAWVVLVLLVGSLASVGAQLYGALHGMPGVQMVDFRPNVRPLFVTKYAGFGLVSAGLLEVARRLLWAVRSGASVSAQLDSEEHRH